MTTIDQSRLAEITGGNAPLGPHASFSARFQNWLKITEGKSPAQLLRLPGPPMSNLGGL